MFSKPQYIEIRAIRRILVFDPYIIAHLSSELVDILETQDIYSMFTLKLYENYHDRNSNYCTLRISRKNLTRVPDSTLSRFFSGEQGNFLIEY